MGLVEMSTHIILVCIYNEGRKFGSESPLPRVPILQFINLLLVIQYLYDQSGLNHMSDELN